MTLITDLTLLPSYDGTEEFVVQKGAAEYKVVGSTITSQVASDLAAYIASNDLVVAGLGSDKLPLAGGTMTGFIVLHADPTTAFHPTTKQYVDAALALKADATGATLDATATGVTAANTVENTTLATTAYVGNKIEYEVLKKTTVSSSPKTLVYAERGTIAVDYTTTNPTVINLPQISGLSSAERTEYYIVDTGNNAGTNTITINAFAGDTINGSSSITINTDGASVLLASKGGTSWFIKDKVATASDSAAGLVELATTAETTALTSSTLAVTPNGLGAFADDRIYKFSEISTPTKVFTEADQGVWYVTYTSTGGVTLTLPDPSTLTNPSRFVLEIWDAGLAGTNTIRMTPIGCFIDGATSFDINQDKGGCKIYNDGTNYFTVANTSRAASTTSTVAIGARSGAGAIPLGYDRIEYSSLLGSEALTLADGTNGQRLTIVYIAETAAADSGILTPTTLLGYSTITFNDIGDSVELEYGTNGWAIISVFNATVA